MEILVRFGSRLTPLVQRLSAGGGLRQRFLSGVFWNLIGTVASRGSTLAAAVIAARILGKHGYGQLAIINSTIVMFSTFAGLGLGVTCTRYIAELRYRDRERAGRVIGLTTLAGLVSGGIMAAALFFGASYLSGHTLNDPQLADELRIASLLLFFGTLSGVQNGSLAGFESFRSIARIGVIQGLCSFPLMVGGILLAGLRGAVLALVLSSALGFVLNKIALNRLAREFGIRPVYRGAWSEAGILWRLSLPSMLSSVMVGPIIWAANALVVNTAGGYASLGLFNAADQWRNLLGVLPGVIGSVLLPMIAMNAGEENHRLEAANILLSWVIVVVSALPLISFPEAIGMLYGSEYASVPYFRSLAFLMFGSCIIAYKEGISRKLVARNLMWWSILSNFLWGGALLGSVLLLRERGAIGLAFSYVASYVFNAVVSVPFYLWKRVVPHRLLVSREIGVVWLVLALQTGATVMMAPLWIRFLLLVLSAAVICRCFGAIWRQSGEPDFA